MEWLVLYVVQPNSLNSSAFGAETTDALAIAFTSAAKSTPLLPLPATIVLAIPPSLGNPRMSRFVQPPSLKRGFLPDPL